MKKTAAAKKARKAQAQAQVQALAEASASVPTSNDTSEPTGSTTQRALVDPNASREVIDIVTQDTRINPEVSNPGEEDNNDDDDDDDDDDANEEPQVQADSVGDSNTVFQQAAPESSSSTLPSSSSRPNDSPPAPSEPPKKRRRKTKSNPTGETVSDNENDDDLPSTLDPDDPEHFALLSTLLKVWLQRSLKEEDIVRGQELLEKYLTQLPEASLDLLRSTYFTP